MFLYDILMWCILTLLVGFEVGSLSQINQRKTWALLPFLQFKLYFAFSTRHVLLPCLVTTPSHFTQETACCLDSQYILQH